MEQVPLTETNGRNDNLVHSLAHRTRKSEQLGPMEISAPRRRMILAGIWLATFLASVNATLVATLISTISSEFKQSNHVSWLGTSYLLATCTFTPLYGRLCSLLGRRASNQTAVVLAGLGALVCSMSNSMEMLSVARFLSGLGGGGIFMTATVIASDMYSLRDRSLIQGVSNIFNGVGLGIGGAFGGWINEKFGWRWAFFTQVPLFVVSFTLTSYNLRYATPGKGANYKDMLRRIDYGGSLSLLGSIASFLAFLSYKYNEELPWISFNVLVPLCFSLALGILFVLLEILIVPEPIMAPFLLRQRVPVAIGISNFLVGMCNHVINYFYPLFFETVFLSSSSIAGLHLLPNSVALSSGSMLAGWILHKTGKYRTMNNIFGVLPFVAALSMASLTTKSGLFAQWFSIVPLGLGNAVVLQTTQITLLAHVEPSVMPVAAGFGQLWRGIGQVSGVAIASAIFQHLLGYELQKRINGTHAEAVIYKIRHSSRLVATLPDDLQSEAREAYASSLRWVFVLAACASFIAYTVRLTYPEKCLDDDPRLSKSALRKSNGKDVSEDDEETEALLLSEVSDFSSAKIKNEMTENIEETA